MENINSLKKYHAGTHRIRSPEDTLARVIPHMSAMGITRIADVTGLDTIGIPVVMVCRPNARSVSVSQGKGSTLAAARVSGLMESIEGYHAENITSALRITSAHDLAKTDNVASMNSLPASKGSPYHPHYPISWIEANDLLSGCDFWLPYEMVHTNYTYPRPSGSGCFSASSNGLASGNNLVEASVHALCEVIERDALSLWHQSGSHALDRSSIDLKSVDNVLCRAALNKLDAAGQDTFVWDITSDTAIPTYFSVIRDRDSHATHIGVGSGTHLSREVALLRTLHEAVQVRTTYIVGARDDITSAEYTTEGIGAKQRLFDGYIRQCSFATEFSNTSDKDSDSVETDLQTLLSTLRRIGIPQVLRVDLTKPEFDISVLRMVVPGMEAPHDEEDYMPGKRARIARQALRR